MTSEELQQWLAKARSKSEVIEEAAPVEIVVVKPGWTVVNVKEIKGGGLRLNMIFSFSPTRNIAIPGFRLVHGCIETPMRKATGNNWYNTAFVTSGFAEDIYYAVLDKLKELNLDKQHPLNFKTTVCEALTNSRTFRKVFPELGESI